MVNHRRFVASMYNTLDLVVRAFGQEPAKEMNDEADEAKTAVTVEAASPCFSELVWINAFLSTREFKFEADDTLVEAESSCQRLGMWYLWLTIAGDGWCLIASLPSFRNRFDKFFLLLPWFRTPSHMVALWWLLMGQFSQETRAFAALLIRRRARPRISSTGRVAVVVAGWVSWWFWIAPNVSLSQCSRWHVWGVSLWIRQGRNCCDRGITNYSKFNERSRTVYRLMVRHVSCCQAMYWELPSRKCRGQLGSVRSTLLFVDPGYFLYSENREEPRLHSRDKKSEMLFSLLILLYVF